MRRHKAGRIIEFFNDMMEYVKNLLIILTFLLLPCAIVKVIYYAFFNYDPVSLLVYLVFAFIIAELNIKLNMR